MSVTPREVPFEVAREGGFPTLEEFGGVWTALADADELGLDRLLGRIAAPIADAYENELSVGYTYENVGVLAARSHDLEVICRTLVAKVESLRALVDDICELIDDGGQVHSAPRFDKYGTQTYEPSREALERWGLAGAVSSDAS